MQRQINRNMMKRVLFFFALMSVIVTAKSQTPTAVAVSNDKVFPELAGDQVITRAYQGQYKITHFRHKDDAYKHSFVIQGGFPLVTKRIQFNINLSILSDTLYRLNVNDMRVEGDSCYFCGNVVQVGPPVMTPQGNMVWPERDSIGFVGFFSLTELIAGHVQMRYKFYYGVYDLTRMAGQRLSPQLMLAAIGTLEDKTTPCVLELTRLSGGSWTESLGYGSGQVSYEAVDSLFAENGEYEWNLIFKNKQNKWHICDATTVVYENTCDKIGLFPYNNE